MQCERQSGGAITRRAGADRRSSGAVSGCRNRLPRSLSAIGWRDRRAIGRSGRFSWGAGLIRAAACGLAIVLGPLSAVAEPGALPPLVKTIIVEDPADGVTRTFFGEVVARKTVAMGFQVGGRMVEFNAPEGEVIPKGATIARLDPEPFEIAVEEAQLTLEQTQRTFDRYEQLVGRAISEAQLLDAQTQVRMAEVALANAEYQLRQTKLIAPFDAVVASRNLANFSTVAAGTEIVRLHDLSELRVDIEVPEVLIQQLGPEPNVTLKAQFPGSDATHPLTYREINAETSAIGQTFRVTLAFEMLEDRLLFPGASVVVRATVNDATDGIAIPVSAIATDPNGAASVFKVVDGADGLLLAETPVTVTVSAEGGITIGDGLEPGTEIVAGGVNNLEDGQRVRRFTAEY